jgi:alpha-glucosidase
MNGADATSLDIPLDFLGAGTWSSSQLRETKDKPDAWDRKDGSITRADHIKVDLSPRGGFVGWIRK